MGGGGRGMMGNGTGNTGMTNQFGPPGNQNAGRGMASGGPTLAPSDPFGGLASFPK